MYHNNDILNEISGWRKVFNENGKLELEHGYIERIEFLKVKEYYHNVNLKFESNYKNGENMGKL